MVDRFTFGPTPATLSEVASLGPDGWFLRQLRQARSTGGYAGLRGAATLGPLLTKTPGEVRRWLAAQGEEYGWTAMDQLSQVTLGLQAWSPNQLYEVLVDVFSNHLNVPNHNGDVWSTRHTMDRDVVRRYALGRFSDMLVASARNPAILLYLNNAESDGSRAYELINENYGRELLELHTVGAGNYTETDVKHSALLMSGRGVDLDVDARQAYVFDPSRHWSHGLTVMGFRSHRHDAAAGEAVGDAYLRYLAMHPATARRVARALCRRLVSDTPSTDLVNQVAAVYRAQQTDIPATVIAILHSTDFWAMRGHKVRRPAESLLATLRVLGVQPTDLAKATEAMGWMTATMGNRPLDWPAPNGYPDVAEAWASSGTLLSEWTYHRGFAQNWWTDLGFSTVDLTTLYGSRPPATSGAAIDALTTRLVGQTLTTTHRAVLQTFLDEPATTPLGQSSLRWWLDHLVPVILDGPHHALR